MSRGICPGGICPGGICPGGYLSRGVYVLEPLKLDLSLICTYKYYSNQIYANNCILQIYEELFSYQCSISMTLSLVHDLIN